MYRIAVSEHYVLFVLLFSGAEVGHVICSGLEPDGSTAVSGVH